MTDSAGGVSRRHVIAGMAWTAPVVLMASALPAAAASGPVAGQVALSGAAASMVEAEFRVTCRVAYSHNNDGITDLPVQDVVVSVVLPTARVSPGFNAVSLNSDWSLVNVSAEDTFTVYKFSWIGGVLTEAIGVTPPLEVNIAKQGGSLDPVDVTLRADGFSGGVYAPQVTQTMPVAVGASLVFNSGNVIRYQNNGGGQFIYAFDGTTRWAGPYWPIGSDATSITLTARIPEANSTGVLVPQYYGPGWTLHSGPVLVNGEWEVVFKYDTALTSTYQSTSTVQFAMVVIEPGVVNVATLRVEGDAAGTWAFDERQGPSNLVTADWDDAERNKTGGGIITPVGPPAVP